jgi:PhnB protein
MSSTITPYLFFGGRCEEALEFYRKAVGAEVNMMMRHNESPDAPPPGMLQPGFENKVMHADVSIQGAHLMVSDGCDDTSTKFDGFRLALTFKTEAAANKAFDALGQGGSVQMPLCKTFWSPCFGMLTDKFGVGWMVMIPAQQP